MQLSVPIVKEVWNILSSAEGTAVCTFIYSFQLFLTESV